VVHHIKTVRKATICPFIHRSGHPLLDPAASGTCGSSTDLWWNLVGCSQRVEVKKRKEGRKEIKEGRKEGRERKTERKKEREKKKGRTSLLHYCYPHTASVGHVTSLIRPHEASGASGALPHVADAYIKSDMPR
jgi:hypothetical protein